MCAFIMTFSYNTTLRDQHREEKWGWEGTQCSTGYHSDNNKEETMVHVGRIPSS